MNFNQHQFYIYEMINFLIFQTDLYVSLSFIAKEDFKIIGNCNKNKVLI